MAETTKEADKTNGRTPTTEHDLALQNAEQQKKNKLHYMQQQQSKKPRPPKILSRKPKNWQQLRMQPKLNNYTKNLETRIRNQIRHKPQTTSS